MAGRQHKPKIATLWRWMLVGVVLIAAALYGAPTPTSGQTQTLRADAIVLVNSASADYADFAFYIRPYLDHFGVPYTLLNLAAAPVPTDLSAYALIIIGHRRLDPQQAYLDATEQERIVTAVRGGVGLVNFDNALADAGYSPLYPYVQEIFGFGYTGSVAASAVAVSSAAAVGGYIVAAQPPNATYTLNAGITPAGVMPPPTASTLVTVGDQPLLVAITSGQGRAVQWTSYEWLRMDIWGYMRGFDDLVWRSLVWAARKPFVMQGLPPFVTFRVDDARGPYGWIETANRYGLKPWIGFFLDEQDATDITDMRRLINAGQLTAAIHSRTYDNFFYARLSDQEIAQNFADGAAWHAQNEIPMSNFVVPHFY